MQLMAFGRPRPTFVVPSTGSRAISNRGASAAPGADAFALEQPRRLVLDALADDDFAANIHQIEHAANRIAGRGIGGFLIPLADPLHAIEGGNFRGAKKIELVQALNVGGH